MIIKDDNDQENENRGKSRKLGRRILPFHDIKREKKIQIKTKKKKT